MQFTDGFENCAQGSTGWQFVLGVPEVSCLSRHAACLNNHFSRLRIPKVAWISVCRAVAEAAFGGLRCAPLPYARLMRGERLQAGAGARACFPQTGDCIANVSARPRDTGACGVMGACGDVSDERATEPDALLKNSTRAKPRRHEEGLGSGFRSCSIRARGRRGRSRGSVRCGRR